MPRCLRHPVLPLLLAAAVAAQGKSPDLESARELIGERTEGQVREGVGICVRRNDVPAVELLLEVLQQTERRTHLHLSPGHYRDIVWEGLEKITDVYARRRVEHELKTGRDPRVRQWCAELLGIYGDRGFGETLTKALSAKDDDLQRWAARSLGMLKHAAAADELAGLSRHKNDYLRSNAIEALARIDPAKYLAPFILAIATDKSGGVRCALLGAAGELCPERLEDLCDKALQDPDWRVRFQAVQHLGATRTKTAVDRLIAALRDVRPVVAARALHELQQLTGQPIQQPDVWVKWWADNRATFAFPDQRGPVQKAAGGTVAYHGLPIDSDHVAFLLDKSFLMKQRLASKGQPKEDVAVAELQRVFELLDEKITFNVWNYHVELEAFVPKPVKLTAKTRAKALEFARAPSKGREKDIWQALFAVVPDASLDTVYLLSSGEPDTGLYVHWNRVTRHLADLNRFHKVTVHTIAFTDNEWFRDQLQKIAEATGGHFEWLK